MKPLFATCIPRSKDTLVWGLASPVISPSNFCKVEASTRSLHINVVVPETYKRRHHEKNKLGRGEGTERSIRLTDKYYSVNSGLFKKKILFLKCYRNQVTGARKT